MFNLKLHPYQMGARGHGQNIDYAVFLAWHYMSHPHIHEASVCPSGLYTLLRLSKTEVSKVVTSLDPFIVCYLLFRA